MFANLNTELQNHIIKLYENERENIQEIAELFANTINKKGIIHLAAIENDKEFLMELYYRAGGIVPFHKVDYLNLVLKNKISYIEYLSLFAHYNHEITRKLLDMYNLDYNDIFVIVYNGKYDDIIAGLLKEIKERNYKVVLLSSLELINNAKLNGNVLAEELARVDYFLDNHISNRMIQSKGFQINTRNQFQTILNNIIAQMLTIETYKFLDKLKYPVNVFLSENIPNANEYNFKIVKPYEGRWNS